MKNLSAYQVLLYYKYVPITEPEILAELQRRLCQRLNLRGRILIASEGMNGTVSGRAEDTDAYMDALHADARFADIVFKVDAAAAHVFPRLKVRVRSEIVTFRADRDVNPLERTGKRLSPSEFYAALERATQSDDVIVLDGRNDYEYDLGHFRNAIRPDVRSFYEFPQWIRENLSAHKSKQIITYCTGGIRCEKLSGLLLDEGFSDVGQLDGGIVAYGKDPHVQGRLFDGKLYVFDDRMSVPVNHIEATVVGQCRHCGTATERYENCRDDTCHFQFLVCDSCFERFAGYCCDECRVVDGAIEAELEA